MTSCDGSRFSTKNKARQQGSCWCKGQQKRCLNKGQLGHHHHHGDEEETTSSSSKTYYPVLEHRP
jgi:hypothetical protein